MIKIQKLNVIKEIDEKSFPEYERMGFSKVDASGKIIKSESRKTMDKIAAFEAALKERDTTIKDLEAIISDRDAKIEELEIAARLNNK